MKKLLTLMLLFTVSSVSAQQADSMAGQELKLTPTVSATLTAPVLSSTPVLTGAQVSSTPIPGMPSVVPGGTPSTMTKPPAFSTPTVQVVSNPVSEHFVLQLDGGMVPSVSSSAASVLGTGFGFDGRLSFAADDVFSIGLESGYYSFGVNVKSTSLPANATSSLTHMPVLIAMQVNLGDSGGFVQPYFILAGGLAFDAYTLTGAAFGPGVTSSWTNFEFDPALGVAFTLDKNTNLFVQVKWAFDFGDNSSSAAESADSPIMFAPIQAGVNFNL